MSDFGGKSLGRMVDILLVIAAIGVLSLIAWIVYAIIALFF
jgi:hypothetical protein